MTIHVTQSHIDAGIKGQCTQCPIALAARVAIGQGHRIQVSFCNIIAICGGYKSTLYPLPQEAQAFVEAFDAGQPVQPFSFKVDIPVEAS